MLNMADVYVAGQSQPEVKPAPVPGDEHGGHGGPRLAVVREVLKRTGETRGSRMMGSYVVCPNRRFVNEQSDEEVVLVLRAHPITNVGWVALTILLLIVPEIVMASGMFAAVPVKYLFVGRLVWYLVTLGFAFEKFLYWYYSLIIITNERIVDIDFVNLLHRVISYAALNHIEEPSMVAGGLLRSLLHYGDVHVSTAAETPTVEANSIPYPDRVIKVISELSEELEKRRERGE